MPSPMIEDDTSSLERARERLYSTSDTTQNRIPLAGPGDRTLPHAWATSALKSLANNGERHVRIAGIFFISAVAFFIVSLGVAGYFFYFGGNTVSVDKIRIETVGPNTIAGGDTLPISLSITNKNPATVENATLEIDFPNGTRSADDVQKDYPRYSEKLGKLSSGERVTRSVKAVLFGSAGQKITIPITVAYSTAGSNAVFVKKSFYVVDISSAPLSVSVETLSETVSNKPLTITLTVRSNATTPLSNIVLVGAFPFGFIPTASSIPLNNSTFLIGTLDPGESKTIVLTGTLTGQNKEQRVFRFTVGTANTPNNQTPAVTYMTQDAVVAIVAPFIDTIVTLNGDTKVDAIMTSGSYQNVTVSYTNTLPTNIANARVEIALSGTAIDYNSIQTSNGFYNSANRTIIFSKDTDPSLAQLAPGASGIGSFTFSTAPAGSSVSSPTADLTISVSGTRIGQSNVAEEISSTLTRSYKVSTAVAFTTQSRYAGTALVNTGPIPPKAEQATSYAIVWNIVNKGSTIADGTVSATLPSYVSYTGVTAGSGTFSYNEKSRLVTWSVGNLAQGASAQGIFQVSLLPSTSQKGKQPDLVGSASFTGYDRFAGVQITAKADPVTTETVGDPGYVVANGTVQ